MTLSAAVFCGRISLALVLSEATTRFVQTWGVYNNWLSTIELNSLRFHWHGLLTLAMSLVSAVAEREAFLETGYMCLTNVNL